MDANKIAAAIERGKREIAEDIAAGRVPATVRDFAALHDYVDANEYGGLCEDGWIEYAGDSMTDETHRAASAVQEALHAWLQEGRLLCWRDDAMLVQCPTELDARHEAAKHTPPRYETRKRLRAATLKAGR